MKGYRRLDDRVYTTWSIISLHPPWTNFKGVEQGYMGDQSVRGSKRMSLPGPIERDGLARPAGKDRRSSVPFRCGKPDLPLWDTSPAHRPYLCNINRGTPLQEQRWEGFRTLWSSQMSPYPLPIQQPSRSDVSTACICVVESLPAQHGAERAAANLAPIYPPMPAHLHFRPSPYIKWISPSCNDFSSTVVVSSPEAPREGHTWDRQQGVQKRIEPAPGSLTSFALSIDSFRLLHPWSRFLLHESWSGLSGSFCLRALQTARIPQASWTWLTLWLEPQMEVSFLISIVLLFNNFDRTPPRPRLCRSHTTFW